MNIEVLPQWKASSFFNLVKSAMAPQILSQNFAFSIKELWLMENHFSDKKKHKENFWNM